MPEISHFLEANAERSAEGAARQIAAVRRALANLTVRGASTKKMAAAGRLRLDHPTATLTELGARHDPPLSKDAIAGRLRRLVADQDPDWQPRYWQPREGAQR